MKQALIEIEKIKGLIEAKEKTKSVYLKNDYSKAIRYRLDELKFYCENKKIKYNDLLEELLNDKKRRIKKALQK